MKILLTIWQLPQFLLGLLLIKLYKATLDTTFKTSNIYISKKFPGSISLGNIIIINTNMFHEMIILHEYGHSIQSLILGWTYLILVGIPSFIRSIIWTKFHLSYDSYFRGYPENWANKLAKIS